MRIQADEQLDVPVQQLDVVVVVVANAPAGDVGREEVREGEGGAQEGERRKEQRGGSVPPPEVAPTCRPLRGRWVWQDS